MIFKQLKKRKPSLSFRKPSRCTRVAAAKLALLLARSRCVLLGVTGGLFQRIALQVWFVPWNIEIRSEKKKMQLHATCAVYLLVLVRDCMYILRDYMCKVHTSTCAHVTRSTAYLVRDYISICRRKNMHIVPTRT